jgi:hypothetical protein
MIILNTTAVVPIDPSATYCFAPPESPADHASLRGR